MAEKFLWVPTSNLNIDDRPVDLTGAVLGEAVTTGLTNGTSYSPFVLGDPGPSVTPVEAVAANWVVFNGTGTGVPQGFSLPWQGLSADFSISEGGGFLTLSRTSIARAALVYDAETPATPNLLTRFRLTSVNEPSASNGVEKQAVFALLSNVSGAAGSETGNTSAAQADVDQSLPDVIRRYNYNNGAFNVQGSENALNAFSLLNTWLYMRYNGTTGEMKVWDGAFGNESAAETVTQSPAITATGKFGFLAFASVDLDIEFISWDLTGSPAPLPA